MPNPTATQFDSLREDIADLRERLAGIDARLQALDSLPQKIDALVEAKGDVEARVTVIESHNGNKLDDLRDDLHDAQTRLAVLEKDNDHQTQRWFRLADLAFKILVGVVSAIILYKLGLH